MVHLEQTEVQRQLEKLYASSPTTYDTIVSEINKAINPGSVQYTATHIITTDKLYGKVLDEVRQDLRREINFSNQGDREALGNALTKEIRKFDKSGLTGKQ